MKPAIVIVAFNRPQSLKRLLSNIKNGVYHRNDIDLIISVDYQESDARNQVVNIATSFSWNHGQKTVITHRTNLGLRKHILHCGDLTAEYGSIILLEDDLVVSSQFYSYAQDALQFYNEDERIAGISLYNHRRHPLNRFDFDTIPDDSDVYFLQFASSWGQAWTSGQWKGFKDWYKNATILQNDSIPEKVKSWPESSWLKFFIKYLVVHDKYFVYPNKSFTTNFSDSGTHNKSKNTDFQVPLFSGEMNSLRFKEIDHAINIYDAFFELIPDVIKTLNKDLEGIDFTVDLWGMKPLRVVKTNYLLSTKPLKNTASGHRKGYALEMKPPVLNVISDLPGNDIKLSEANLFENDFKGLDISKNLVWDYFVFKLIPSVYVKIFTKKVLLKLRKK